MKLGAIPENLLERIVLALGLAPTPLSDTHVAFMLARTIMVAAKLGIFETLNNASSKAEDVAAQIRTDPQATTKLLNTLIHLGYVRQKDQHYALTPLARKWMLKDSPTSLYDKMLLQFIEWELVEHYENYVRTGEPINMHQTFNEQQWDVYQRGMRSVAGTSAWEIAKRTPIPKGATDMLDIGGSHGYYSVTLCRRHPHLRSVILDLPKAVTHAEKILANENMGDRVLHRAGDILTEDLGEETWDVIFIASLVHHFSNATNHDLAKKVYKALRPGGVYIVQDFIRDDSPKKGDHLGGLLDLYFAATSQSGTWSVKDITNWQKEAGLIPKKTIWLHTVPRHAQLVAMKP